MLPCYYSYLSSSNRDLCHLVFFRRPQNMLLMWRNYTYNGCSINKIQSNKATIHLLFYHFSPCVKFNIGHSSLPLKIFIRQQKSQRYVSLQLHEHFIQGNVNCVPQYACDLFWLKDIVYVFLLTNDAPVKSNAIGGTVTLKISCLQT
mmetsp:Transcript_17574/g.26185  ORF Transcript_17574/g.26185 Transcript_17574/m.26185 type:complete len:147 (-) Transcript_17574:1243-1683(-)